MELPRFSVPTILKFLLRMFGKCFEARTPLTEHSKWRPTSFCNLCTKTNDCKQGRKESFEKLGSSEFADECPSITGKIPVDLKVIK